MSFTRLMLNDPTMMNPKSFLDVAKLVAVSDIVSPTKEYIRASGDAGLIVSENVVITIGSEGVFRTEMQTALSESDLDTGSFAVGNDYYVYACDIGGDNGIFKISLNSTFPSGFNPANSRKIGGFHYGVCRRINAKLQPVNAAAVERGSGWEGNVYSGIVPRSVWTVEHRPKSDPEGMVYLCDGTWVDIYKSSLDGAGKLQSVFNEFPATGTEGFNWYHFSELLLASNKRMLTYSEFCMAALGAPPGADGNNNNAWAATSNTARQRTGFVANAVSSIGCRDTTGNVNEWINELISRYDATGSYAPTNTWAWHDVFAGYGKAHMNHSRMLGALYVGGIWNVGVSAGPRCVVCGNFPWVVGAAFGVRGASGSL